MCNAPAGKRPGHTPLRKIKNRTDRSTNTGDHGALGPLLTNQTDAAWHEPTRWWYCVGSYVETNLFLTIKKMCWYDCESGLICYYYLQNSPNLAA
jgi:hypothetical protein